MTPSSEGTAKRPRYLQVRDQLVHRIKSGVWAPGEAIPSELDIAREFKVSQGTARSAVEALASENIVVRHQGLGTFVFQHTSEDELTRFFCLFDGNRARIDVGGHSCRVVGAVAGRAERRELRLEEGSKVVRITRLRVRGGRPFCHERICLPEAMFPGLAESSEQLPDTLYELYQRAYRVHVLQVEERLTAVAAEGAIAKALKVAGATPLLRIERVALALDRRPVEWRVSHCYLADGHYRSRLR